MQQSKIIFSIFTLIILVFSCNVGATIDSELFNQLQIKDPDDYVRLIIRMDDNEPLPLYFNNWEVQSQLKQSAQQSQSHIFDFLLQHSDGVKASTGFWISNVVFVEIKAKLVAPLAKLQGIAKIYQDYELRIEKTSLDTSELLPQATWDHIDATFAPEIWARGFKGQGITVAVLDTGVDISHPELRGALGGEPPYHQGYWAEIDRDGNKRPFSIPRDSHYHGTHVSGTVAARNINYVIGMAPEVTLAHGLVIPTGRGTLPQILGGLQWVIEQGFDIVNGSFGAPGLHEDLLIAVENIAAAGIVPVFSVGNYSVSAPGNTPAAVGVGAFDANGLIPDFHAGAIVQYPGHQPQIKPDISAPGVEIWSTVPGGNYYAQSGTSMAAPHVAGGLALLMSFNSDVTVTEIIDIIYNSTGGHQQQYGWPHDPEKNTDYGWGRFNVRQALEMMPFPGPAATVTGVVYDHYQQPLKDVKVVFQGTYNYFLTTDKDGFFSVTLLEDFYQLTAEKMGFQQWKIKDYVPAVGTENYLEIELIPAEKGLLTGYAWDAHTKEPLAATTISVLDQRVSTDQEGFYQLELTAGQYNVVAAKKGYHPVKAKEVAIFPLQTTTLDFEVPFGHNSVEFVVKNQDQIPLENVIVEVVELDITQPTDELGQLSFDLEQGIYNINFNKVGYQDKDFTIEVLQGEITQHQIVLDYEMGTLKGQVFAAAEPLAEVLIVVEALNMQTVTDEAGNYKFPLIARGVWDLTIIKDGYYQQDSRVKIEKDSLTTQNFYLAPIEELLLFNTDFSSENWAEPWIIEPCLIQGEIVWQRTDRRSAEGSYSLWNGNPALNRHYTPTNSVFYTKEFFEIEQGSFYQLDFSIWIESSPSYAHFFVFLQDEDNLRHVIFEDYGFKRSWHHYSINLEGTDHKKVQLGFGFISTAATLAFEGVYVDNISLQGVKPQQKGSVTGQVFDQDSQEPLAGVSIKVLQKDDNQQHFSVFQSTTTDQEGRYNLELRGGSYQLIAEFKPDYKSKDFFITIKPNQETKKKLGLTYNQKPEAVSDLAVIGLSATTIHLGWAMLTENIAYYEIYRSLNNEDFSLYGQTDKTEFVAQYLQEGFNYYFKIRAVDSYGKASDFSNTVSAIPQANKVEIKNFNLQPRSVIRGGQIEVSAQLISQIANESKFELVLKMYLGYNLLRKWEFTNLTTTSFQERLDLVDRLNQPLAPNIYSLQLEAYYEGNSVGQSNLLNIVILTPLPQSLSFVVDNNPFNPTVESQRIEYHIPEQGTINLAVYTVNNQLIKTLKQTNKSPGQYVVYWDGKNQSGATVLSGIYIIKAIFNSDSGGQTQLIRHSVVIK